jgi:hypothetical protein
MASRVASRRFITLEYVLARQELSGVRLGTQKRGNPSLPGGGHTHRFRSPRVKSKMDPLRAKRTVPKCTRSCLAANLGESAPEVATLSALNTPVSCDPPRKSDAHRRYERCLTTFMEAPLYPHKASKLDAPTH